MIRLANDLWVTVEISHDTVVLIKHQDIRGLACKFTDNLAWSIFGGELKDDNPVVR